MAALSASGRRPAREIATRELRSERSISRPALALPPPTGTAATSTPAGLAPPSSRAARTTWPYHHPPAPQPHHRYRSHTTLGGKSPIEYEPHQTAWTTAA